MQERRGRLQPARTGSENRQLASLLTIRCGTEQLEAWKRTAEAAGMPLSLWVRLNLDAQSRGARARRSAAG